MPLMRYYGRVINWSGTFARVVITLAMDFKSKSGAKLLLLLGLGRVPL